MLNRRRLGVLKVFLITFLAFGFLACASSSEKKSAGRTKGLSAAAKSYNESMRWQRYSIASRYVPKDVRDQFLISYERQRETLNITETELVSAEVDEDDLEKATVRVWVSYFRYPNVKLEKELQIQAWHFDAKKDRWFIDLPNLEKVKP